MDNNERLERYAVLKKQVERCRQEVSRAEGALGELKERLRREFGCNTLQEARRLQARLEKEAAELERRFDVELERFERRWGEVLEGGED